MATIKAFTDLPQSLKLAEILPHESADMEYLAVKENGALVVDVPFVKDNSEVEDSAYSHTYDRIACWSLTALLNILPEYNLQRTVWGNKTEYKIVVYVNDDVYASNNYDNEVDACVSMIEKLNELNLL